MWTGLTGSGARPRAALLSLASLLAAGAGFLCASEVDVQPDEAWSHASPLVLSPAADRQTEAMARFAQGIFEEEMGGPDAALRSYRRTLALEPGYLNLAVRVAQELLRRGDVAGAIGILKDAAKAKPKDYLPPLLMASIYLRHLQKPALAETQARRALELAPDQFAAVGMLWEVCHFSGQAAKGAKVLAEALRSRSDNPAYWLGLADLLRRLPPSAPTSEESRTAWLEKAVERAVASAQNDPDALARAGDLRVLLGQVAEAADLYRRAHSLDPSIPNLTEKLAASLVETGRMDEAEPLLLEMIAANPQSLPVCDRLASLYLERGDFEKALAFRQRALILAPYQPERHLDVADLLLGLGRIELAIHYLEQARERFPRAGIFTYLTAVAYTRADQPEKAVGLFETALAESTAGPADFLSGKFYFEYGVAAEQAGLYERAADLFKKAIEIDPANAARAGNYLGFMWVERNENLDEAERLIRAALQSEPNNGAYMDSLGWLFFRQGRFADALVHLLRAAELIGEPDPVVFDHIGDAYQQLGRNPEAILYWQKSLQLDPENSALAEKIEKASDRIAHGPTPAPAKP